MSVESVTYEEPADDEPSIFDIVDPDHDARVEAEADDDIAAGRLIPNEEVIAWLRTWGTPGEQEPPAEWFK
jgi:predicted transcriptional regulator